MSLARPVQRYTVEEYYRLERAASFKSEYYQGEIFAMAGTSTRHSVIAINIGGELHARLKGSPCGVYDSNQRLKVPATGLRAYPDLSVYCGEMDYDTEDSQRDTATNPTVVFEILSESTEAYDRGTKSQNFRQVESLKAYVLVSQDEPRVEVYRRQGGQNWLLQETSGLAGVVRLPDIGIELPMREIYDRVKFGPETPANEGRAGA